MFMAERLEEEPRSTSLERRGMARDSEDGLRDPMRDFATLESLDWWKKLKRWDWP